MSDIRLSRPALAVLVTAFAFTQALAATATRTKVKTSQETPKAEEQDPADASPGWNFESFDKDRNPVDCGRMKGSGLTMEFESPEMKLREIPPQWKDENLRKDPLFMKIQEMKGEKTLVIQDGVPVGVKFDVNGEKYLYVPSVPPAPPAKFAFPADREGLKDPKDLKVVSLDGEGKALQERPYPQLSAEEKKAVDESRKGLTALKDTVLSHGGRDIVFDNMFLSGGEPGAVVTMGRRPAAKTSDFLQPPYGMTTKNVYDKEPPAADSLKAGDLFWKGKNLMRVTEAGKADSAREVGYMAAMKEDDQKGTVIFWHGGDVPDEKGLPATEKGRNWALFSVEQGQTSARHMGGYYGFVLDKANKVDTPNGPRVELWTALEKPREVFRKDDSGKMVSGGEKALFSFGKPVKSMQRYWGTDGSLYTEQKVDGKTMLVFSGRLHNRIPVNNPESDGPAPAPAREESAPPQPASGAPAATGQASSPAASGSVPVPGSQGPSISAAPAPKLGNVTAALTDIKAHPSNLRYSGKLSTLTDFLRTTPGDPTARQLQIEVAQELGKNFGSLNWASAYGDFTRDDVRSRIESALGSMMSRPGEGLDSDLVGAAAKSYAAMGPVAGKSKVSTLLAEGGLPAPARLQLAAALAANPDAATAFKEQIRPVLKAALLAKPDAAPFGDRGVSRRMALDAYAGGQGLQELGNIVVSNHYLRDKKDPELLAQAVDAVDRNRGAVPGAPWWGVDQERAGALNVLRTAIIYEGVDPALKERALKIGRLLGFTEKDLTYYVK